VDAPTDLNGGDKKHVPPPLLLQEDEAGRIAIALVKRREGWLGKVDFASQEAYTWYVTVGRQTEKHPARQEIRKVKIDAKTGRMWDYRDANDPNVAEASQAWNELLAAMAGRDEKRIRQLTTPAGFEALKRVSNGDVVMHVFERRGEYWQRCGTRWRHLDGPDRVECSAGAEPKENGFVFKRTAEGWKLDKWYRSAG
jgi:hypothetical protein